MDSRWLALVFVFGSVGCNAVLGLAETRIIDELPTDAGLADASTCSEELPCVDDGVYCNGAPSCSEEGLCEMSTPIACPPNEMDTVCTTNGCSEEVQVCQQQPRSFIIAWEIYVYNPPTGDEPPTEAAIYQDGTCGASRTVTTVDVDSVCATATQMEYSCDIDAMGQMTARAIPNQVDTGCPGGSAFSSTTPDCASPPCCSQVNDDSGDRREKFRCCFE